MDIEDLRLHGPDDKCKHGDRYSHQGGDTWYGMDSFDSSREMARVCPGGAAVGVDYEAAYGAVWAIWPTVLSETLAREAARTAVDAALGLTDD